MSVGPDGVGGGVVGGGGALGMGSGAAGGGACVDAGAGAGAGGAGLAAGSPESGFLFPTAGAGSSAVSGAPDMPRIL